MRMAAIGIVAGGLAWTTWANGPAPRQEQGQDFQWHGHLAAGQTVTIRARDAMTQERVAIAQLGEYIGSRIRGG